MTPVSFVYDFCVLFPGLRFSVELEKNMPPSGLIFRDRSTGKSSKSFMAFYDWEKLLTFLLLLNSIPDRDDSGKTVVPTKDDFIFGSPNYPVTLFSFKGGSSNVLF